MKKFLASLVMVVLMVAVFASISSAGVRRSYVGASQRVDFTNPAFTSDNIDLTARLKADVVGTGGFDVSAGYNTGSSLKGSPLTVGLFYEADDFLFKTDNNKWELAVDTTFPADNFNHIGKDSRVMLWYGIGLP